MYNKYLILTLSFFSLIIILPFIGIFSKLNFDFYSLLVFINNTYILKIIYFTFYQAFFSAVLSCLIAIPFALALNRHKNLKIIRYLVSICGFSFVIPSILIVYAVIKLFGINGFYNNYFNFYELLEINSIYGLKSNFNCTYSIKCTICNKTFFSKFR